MSMRPLGSEARLSEAQRIAHVGSWEWDVASDRVTWTDEMYRIYGIQPADFDHRYEGFLQRVLPEDREHTQSVVLEAYRANKPFIYDHRIKRPDGSVRMLHTVGEAFADSDGKVARLAGACWDITDRWCANREREHSLSVLRATLESTADGLLVVDCEGRVVAHNQRLLDLLGSADAGLQSLSVLAADPAAETFDRLELPDGHLLERYSRPQRIGDEIVGRVWSYRDVTERERLLQRKVFLADSSRLLASLDVEPALCAVARLAVPFMGDGCAIDLLGEGQWRRVVVVSRDATRPFVAELPHVVLSGASALYAAGSSACMAVPLLVRGQLLGALSFVQHGTRKYDDADLGLAGELAHRVELALENAQLYRNAQDALSARDEFLAVAAHEIRGPVTALHLAVQSLQQAPAGMAAQLGAIIERENRRLTRLVDELLDVTHLRSGKLLLELEPVDLAAAVRRVVERLAPDLARSRSALCTTAPGQLIGSWDRSRVDQVVYNLLSNAIRFGLGKPIDLRVDTDGEYATLTVRDQGIGIAPEAQQRIFDPFERAVAPRHYGGLGMGLFVVRSILEAMGGSVHVDSQLGAGATFTVRLPLTRAT
jgi:PAS domain S-box-containing protein